MSDIIDKSEILHELKYHNDCRDSRVSVYLNANQSIPNGVWTTINFTTVLYDNLSEWDAVNYKFIPKENGIYHFDLQTWFQSVLASVNLYLQGTGGGSSPSIYYRTPINISPVLAISRDISITTRQHLLGQVYNGDVAARNIFGSNSYTYLTIHRVA